MGRQRTTCFSFLISIEILMGFLAIPFLSLSRGLACCINPPNLEDQVIFDQGFHPLALDTPVSDCRAAVLVLVRPGY
jgi:hypothetical protein